MLDDRRAARSAMRDRASRGFRIATRTLQTGEGVSSEFGRVPIGILNAAMLRRLRFLLHCAIALVLWTSTSSALPRGRAWSPPVRLIAAPVDQIVALDLLPDANGTPSVLALGRSSIGAPGRPRWWSIAWSDSAWAAPDSIPGAVGEGPAPVVARAADRVRLWIEARDVGPVSSPL